MTRQAVTKHLVDPRRGEPRLVPAPGPREAAFHQSGADQRDRRALDRQVRAPAPERAVRPQENARRRRRRQPAGHQDVATLSKGAPSWPTARFVYVTYIRTTPGELWTALTEPEFTEEILVRRARCESDWKAGSPWRLVFPDGRIADAGEIVEVDPPRRLVHQMAQRIPARAEERRRFALRDGARAGGRRGEAHHHPYDRSSAIRS